MERQLTKQEMLVDVPTAQAVDVSVVIPVFNEVESLPPLHKQIVAALTGLKQTWEIVYVDDGSEDGSSEALEMLAAESPKVTVVVAPLIIRVASTPMSVIPTSNPKIRALSAPRARCTSKSGPRCSCV